jgi:hypothetical protein
MDSSISPEARKDLIGAFAEAGKTWGVPSVMVFILMAGIWMFLSRTLDIGARVADAHIAHMQQVGVVMEKSSVALEKIASRLDTIEKKLEGK